jgi:HSP20 family molecular chaperone IbpA
MDGSSAELRLSVPFVEKAEIDLKKIGLELIVRVGGHKRNIVLPSALAAFRPREAKLEDGLLRVRFERHDGAAAAGAERRAALGHGRPFAGLGGMLTFSSFEDRPPQ